MSYEFQRKSQIRGACLLCNWRGQWHDETHSGGSEAARELDGHFRTEGHRLAREAAEHHPATTRTAIIPTGEGEAL